MVASRIIWRDSSANFAANGYDPGLRGFVQLMRARMFSHGPCEFRPATDDFANKLKVRGIPFGPPE